MNTLKNKKIQPGLAAILFGVLIFVVFSLGAKTAHAYVPTTPQQVQNAAFQFINRGLIIGDFDGNKVNFIDEDPFDAGIKLEAQNYDCDAYIGGDSGMNGTFALSNLGSYPGSLDTRYIHIEYDPKNGDGCTQARVLKSPAGVDVGMRTWFEWIDAGRIESIDSKLVFTKTGSNDYFLLESEAGKGCQDRVFVNGNTGKYFELAENDGLDPSGTDARSLNLSGCDIVGYNFFRNFGGGRGSAREPRFNELFKNSFRIGEESNAAKAAGTGVSKTQAALDGDESSCEGKNNSGLEWLFCGALSLIDKMVNSLTDEIEGLLNFNTGKYLNDDVRLAWSIIKNIATILLVIVMLVMVLSQAISVGGFDAYTVRKILPKIVIAVIIMQISFPMLVWFIQLANASGEAVRDLMYAPFGGSSKMQLDDLVGQLGKGTATLSVTALFTGIAVSVLFSGITIGGAVFLGIAAMLSVLVGWLVLILRQILIILAVILVPIALVMWILPGTQRYWKLWSDNFIKLLLLFPLIMGMIAAGRIFADIAGDTDNLLALFVVFVGVFGPLWFLPKAFGWGGQMFSMASSVAWNGTKGMRNLPGKYAMSNAKLNREQRAQARLERLGEGKTAGVRGRWDTLLAGGYNYTRSSRTREKMFESSKAQGRETAEKAVAQSIVGSRYEALTHPEKLATLETLAAGGTDTRTGLDAKENAILQRWALDQLATFGDWDKISDLRDRNDVDRRTWEMFVAKNIGSIHQKAPHLSPLKSDLSRNITAQDLTTMHGEGIDEVLRQYHGGYVRDKATGAIQAITDRNELIAHRQRLKNVVEKALGTEYIAGQLTTDVQEKLATIRNADAGNLEGRFIPGRTESQDRVELPSDMTTPEAQNSLRFLMASGGRFAKAASRDVATRVAHAPAGHADEQAFRGLMDRLATMATNSPKAKNAHNRLLEQFQASLNGLVDEAEQQAVAQGMSPANIAAHIQQYEQFGRDKKARIDNLGAQPIQPLP